MLERPWCHPHPGPFPRSGLVCYFTWRVSQRADAGPSHSTEMQCAAQSTSPAPFPVHGTALLPQAGREQLESCCFSWWHSAVSQQRAPPRAVPSWSSWIQREEQQVEDTNKIVVWGTVWESLPLWTKIVCTKNVLFFPAYNSNVGPSLKNGCFCKILTSVLSLVYVPHCVFKV